MGSGGGFGGGRGDGFGGRARGAGGGLLAAGCGEGAQREGARGGQGHVFAWQILRLGPDALGVAAFLWAAGAGYIGQMRSGETRQYRILDVVGRGGFGTVYRAELHGSGGFVKEVALKVLNEAVEANPEHLARLRDEARMLGLVRHRAGDRRRGADQAAGSLDDRDGVRRRRVAARPAEVVRSLPDPRRPRRPRGGGGRAVRRLHLRRFATASRCACSTADVKPSNVRNLGPRRGQGSLDFGVARAEFALKR